MTMEENEVRPGSLRAWLLAARPKTLTGAATPVMISMAMAYVEFCRTDAVDKFSVLVAALCFLFAFIMQIDANFINDYFDFMKGTDDRETRLGPKRACAQGWISPHDMRTAIATTTILACVVGLPLIYYGGFTMIYIGLLCFVFCFLYTTSLSYIGLGDLLVILFFGIVPVCVPYYLQMSAEYAPFPTIDNGWAVINMIISIFNNPFPDFYSPLYVINLCPLPVFLASIACGLAIDALLIVNNYRDRDTDRAAGKRTIVVLIGEKWTERLYLGVGVAAWLICVVLAFMGSISTMLLPLTVLYLIVHIGTWRRLVAINHGKALNSCLADTARNILIFGITLSLALLMEGRLLLAGL